MALQLLTVFVAQLFDFGTFVVMVDRHGAAAESNPLVTDLLGDAGLPGVAIVKVALVILVGSVVLMLAGVPGPAPVRRMCQTAAPLVAGAAIAAGLLGGISNALTFGSL